MRGIVSAAGYVPYRRLARADIAAFMGSGGGKGTRAVASHDEDTTTLGVEAARLGPAWRTGADARRRCGSPPSRPAYLDKTNATAVAAALRLPADVGAYDFGGALRSGIGACWRRCAAKAPPSSWRPTCATACPTSGTRRPAATPARAVLVGDGPDVLAEFVAAASATDEFTDRWRAPGDRVSKLWEERFGENRYLALGRDALDRALKSAGLEPRATWAGSWSPACTAAPCRD